jgi:hypothetical protein
VGRQMHLWDIALLKGHSVVGGWAPPGPDGLYPSLRTPGDSPTNGVCVFWSRVEAPSRSLHILGAHQDGRVSSFTASS